MLTKQMKNLQQEDAVPNEVMLRMLITQAQAKFLVRKDGATVRLQRIRNQMKAIGASCDIKLYDDKGQSEPMLHIFCEMKYLSSSTWP